MNYKIVLEQLSVCITIVCTYYSIYKLVTLKFVLHVAKRRTWFFPFTRRLISSKIGLKSVKILCLEKKSSSFRNDIASDICSQSHLSTTLVVKEASTDKQSGHFPPQTKYSFRLVVHHLHSKPKLK